MCEKNSESFFIFYFSCRGWFHRSFAYFDCYSAHCITFNLSLKTNNTKKILFFLFESSQTVVITKNYVTKTEFHVWHEWILIGLYLFGFTIHTKKKQQIYEEGKKCTGKIKKNYLVGDLKLYLFTKRNTSRDSLVVYLMLFSICELCSSGTAAVVLGVV